MIQASQQEYAYTTAATSQQPCPTTLVSGEGAISDFFNGSSNRLIITDRLFSDTDVQGVFDGRVQGGFLAKNGAVILLWRLFTKSGYELASYMTPIDARLIPTMSYGVNSMKGMKLHISAYAVSVSDQCNGGYAEIKDYSEFSMPARMTLSLLQAVQNQAHSDIDGVSQQDRWSKTPIESLVEEAQMHDMLPVNRPFTGTIS
ncbi:MAG: hypothetical protein JXK16_06315 [Thiotrichales bacterium]|nr:hypothetical protein [Thiotrichales bacterium]